MSAVVRRRLGASILSDSGQLRASITAGKGKGAVRHIGNNYLDFGTNLPQAKRLQFGGTWPVTAKQRAFLSAMLGEWFLGKSITTPARPFLGVSTRCKGELSRGAATVANRLLKAAVQ
jgi:phage gpG-like protein